MNNLTSTQPFLFEYIKKDLLIHIDKAKCSLFHLEQLLYDHPELLFNNLCLNDGHTTKIIIKIKEQEKCLRKLNEDLANIDAHLSRVSPIPCDMDIITNGINLL